MLTTSFCLYTCVLYVCKCLLYLEKDYSTNVTKGHCTFM